MSGELKLVEPSLEWTAELRGFIAAFKAENRSHIPGLLPDDLLDDPETLIKRNRDFSRGENLPQGWVPASTWFGVQDRTLVGVINLRHRLVPALERIGGHIGYSVHPQQQKKGYGTRILALVLPHARALGIQRVLLTCDDANIASARVIEKNGGVLSDKIPREGGGITRRYWLEV